MTLFFCRNLIIDCGERLCWRRTRYLRGNEAYNDTGSLSFSRSVSLLSLCLSVCVSQSLSLLDALSMILSLLLFMPSLSYFPSLCVSVSFICSLTWIPYFSFLLSQSLLLSSSLPLFSYLLCRLMIAPKSHHVRKTNRDSKKVHDMIRPLTFFLLSFFLLGTWCWCRK